MNSFDTLVYGFPSPANSLTHRNHHYTLQLIWCC